MGRRVGNAKGINMALTRDFRQTVMTRVDRDPEFASALLDEARTVFHNDDSYKTKLLLRKLVKTANGTRHGSITPPRRT